MAEPYTQSQGPQGDLNNVGASFQRWRTRDILTIIVVGIVFGLLLTASTPITLLLGPVGWFWSGLWTLGPLFMVYVMRRPWVVLLTGILCELVQWPLSQGGGISGIIRGILFGLAVELMVLLWTRYRSFGLVRMTLLGASNGIMIFLASAGMAPFLWGYSVFIYEPAVLATIIVTLIVSSAICGALAKLLADAVARTGVLSNMALGKEREMERERNM